MTTVTTYRYRATGTTDDVTQCEICGKPELKGTVRLAVVDPDGNAVDEVYAGVTCAARRAGRTVPELKAEAVRATRAREDAARRERARQAQAETDEFLAWVRDTYDVRVSQTSDLWDRVPGFTPYSLRKVWKAQR